MIRWVFAAVGFLYGRFVGALIGYGIGALLERSWRRPVRRSAARQDVHLMQDLVTLAMAVARADGRLDRAEVRAIRGFFERHLGFRGPMLTWLREAVRAEADTPRDWRAAAQRLQGRLGPLERGLMLRVLVGVAQADGRLDAGEQALLQELAQRWGLGVAGAGPGPGAPGGKDRRWALQVLGLEEGASAEEIERAYRRLVREKHPDRFEHMGAEFAEAAHEQFVEIQEARRILKREA